MVCDCLALSLKPSCSQFDSVQLLDYESETAKGRFHYNSIRIGNRFLKTYMHGFGHNYLEFQSHPLAHGVELISKILFQTALAKNAEIPVSSFVHHH
jgi:hypothetical protein